MKNILTVDLEDWFSVEVLNTVLGPEKWADLESVVRRNTYKILWLFDQHKVSATFFILGWIAERYPDLIRETAAAGHEIACHSYHHQMVSSLTPQQFRDDTRKALDAIMKASDRQPRGYRSPSWGMKRDMQWAYDILDELGFEYDSSIFPISHDIYGDPGAPRTAFRVPLASGGSMIEIPATTIDVLGRRMAIGGGGWLRQFPYWFTRWGIRKLNRQGSPAMIYFHPWELDTELPESNFFRNVIRKRGSLKNWIRQYKNLTTMQTKVEKLLTDFDFITVSAYIESLNSKANEARK